MKIIGKVDSLWRYPVKSMRGEELKQAFVGFAGVYGDRLFAFKDAAAPSGFPYLTAREKQNMLLYRPYFQNPDKAAKPPNLTEAEEITPGITPIFGDSAELALNVETPSGEVLAVDDPTLINKLLTGLKDKHALTLLRSDRAFTDCRPVSLLSLQTTRQLSEEVETILDKRSFRANIYMDLEAVEGFGEHEFVGKTLQIGSKVVLSVLERDPRCKMITLDPDTAEANPKVLRIVARDHNGMAGIYSAVLVEGSIKPGDEIKLF
ncbi:MAG: MOSC domain-containing protein [Rhodospirillaceae bacterium]|nr:MOSC domain-containing protein [Rhodospirillaceae bacterium]